MKSGQQTRTDCTVVETPLHKPTDSSLLWDGIRRLTLVLNRAVTAGYKVPATDRMREAKRAALAILNAANEEERQPLYEQLLKLAWATAWDAQERTATLEKHAGDERAQGAALKLRQGMELLALLRHSSPGGDELVVAAKFRWTDAQRCAATTPGRAAACWPSTERAARSSASSRSPTGVSGPRHDP